MLSYIIRRILYAIPILVGVNVIVFILFFFVNTPDDMARLHLGEKRVTPEQIDRWKRERSLDLPSFFNQGWMKRASVSSVKQNNKNKIILPLETGEYKIQVETPENKELASRRAIKIKFSGIQRMTPPPEQLSEIKLSKESEEDMITFQILETLPLSPISENKGTGKLASVSIEFISFDVEASTHRLVLWYKTPIGFLERFTKTTFFTRSLKMLFFQYGRSDDGKLIQNEVSKRILPSLAVTLPTFIVGMILNIFFAMILAFLRGSSTDKWGVFLCVVGMSVSTLFYIIFGQVVLGKWLKLFPISGFGYGASVIKFIIMPVSISIIAGLGGTIRLYRTIFLEEINREYVLTARSKGLPEHVILFLHVLKNAMIPILTGVVVYLPFLFIGSLLLESFFAIPGLGAYLLEAIQRKDFAVVQAMVSLGSFLYIVGLIMTDISYTLVDPRVRLQ